MTTRAATPAANSKVDSALADVAGATTLAVATGAWPKTDFETVAFILYSLQKGFDTLRSKNIKTVGRILGLILVLFNFIFMMCIIHIGDELAYAVTPAP
jgi:hypothetical protein